MITPDPDSRYVTPANASPDWARLRDSLLDLSRLGGLAPDQAMAELLRTAAMALGVARVSFWRFDGERKRLERELMHVRDSGRDDRIVSLKFSQAPRYFAALEQTLTLAAEDVRLDDRTQELLENYLQPLGIGAMLDVVVRSGGRPAGVICHEHIGGPRAWSAEQRMFAAAIAALAGQQLEYGERIRAEAERSLALLSDALTGLPNRTRLLEALAALLQAPRPQLGALLVVDVDHFHRVNHAFGAEVGDRVLAQLAQRLAGLYPRERLARLGNDQFVVLCLREEVDSIERASDEAARLQRALQAPLMLDDRRLEMSVSVGVLAQLDDYETPEAMLRDAIIAADTAARGPRSSIVLFDPGIREQVAARLSLELELRRAVREGEFEFWVEPIVRAADGSLRGVEALLRWRHPKRGVLAPSDFLAVAEEEGLLAAIHARCLPALLEATARWRRRPRQEELSIGLNLAGSQLADPDLAAALAAQCLQSGLPMSALHLEITENTLLATRGGVESGLTALRARGARLSLDDFGTGHASLAHLIRLPLSSIKIDGSFVAQLGREPRFTAAVRGIVRLARAMDLKVIAEGVDDDGQLRLLRQMHCDALQGRLFGLAAPLAEFERRWILEVDGGASGGESGLPDTP